MDSTRFLRVSASVSTRRRWDEGDGFWQHVHLDHLGSTRLVTKGSQILSQEEFDPYGEPIDKDDRADLRIGFGGHEADRNAIDPYHWQDGQGLTYNFGASGPAPVSWTPWKLG
jgi:hypothetical protein